MLNFTLPKKLVRYEFYVSTLVVLSISTGCSPAFNWRDVRPEHTTVQALFPCKPEQTIRRVALGDREVRMTMLGCEAGGAAFTLLYADTEDSAGLNATLGAWRQATLGNVHAQAATARPFLLNGVGDQASAVSVTTNGVRQDGSAMAVQGLWFAVGSQVFQATVTSDAANPMAADTFFAGFRTQ